MPNHVNHEAVRGISLNRVLCQLRANAKLNRLKLPERSPFGIPICAMRLGAAKLTRFGSSGRFTFATK
jgi:hypothetical protein